MRPTDNADPRRLVNAPIKSPFNDYLGMQFFSTADNGLEVRLPIRADLLNSAGIVHGGVYASLGDVALSAAIYTRAAPLQVAITVEMSCRYLRAAREGVLCALGRVVHLGNRIVVAEADILVDGILQYTTSGTYTLMPRSPKGAVGHDQGAT